jgi:hypothetical protein
MLFLPPAGNTATTQRDPWNGDAKYCSSIQRVRSLMPSNLIVRLCGNLKSPLQISSAAIPAPVLIRVGLNQGWTCSWLEKRVSL